MIKKIFDLLIVIFLFSTPGLSRTIVYGRVTGADGKAIQVANVFLCHPSESRPVDSVMVRRNGYYEVDIPSSGIWMLHFTGIFHREYPIAIYAINGTRLQLNVRLRTYNYGSIFTPAVIGNFNGWSVEKSVPFHKAQDGIYSAKVRCNSDTLFYRLVHVRTGGEVEGTDADGYVPNGIENYDSYLVTVRRKVTINFDPDRLPYSKKPTIFKLAEGRSFEARFARAVAGFENARQDYFESFFKSVVDHHMMGFKFNYAPYLGRVKSMLQREHSKPVRQALELSDFSIRYMSTDGYVIPKICRLLLNDLAPRSLVWSLRPSTIYQAAELSGLPKFKRTDFFHEVLNLNPVAETKVTLLMQLITMDSRGLTPDKLKPYLSILVDQYGGFPQAAECYDKYSSYLSIKKGSPAPDFSIDLYPDTTSRITNHQFKGRYYLLDFWSPSNRGSVKETRYLHSLQERIGSNNLEMISVALNFDSKSKKSGSTAERVLQFNTKVWHGFDNKLCREFEVYSVPKLVLVDPQGVIAASGWKLLGPKIEEVIRKTSISELQTSSKN